MKVLLVILSLVLLIGVVSADTLIIQGTYDRSPIEGTPDAVFPTLRNGAGDGTEDTDAGYLYSWTVATSTQDIFNYNMRGGTTWNTSTIPDDATISSTILSVYYLSKYNSAGSYAAELIDFTPLNPNSYTGTDYSRTTFTQMSANISYASITTSAWNNFTLNSAGISKINKTGFTSFLLSTSADVYNINLSLTWISGGITGYRIRPLTGGGGLYKQYLTITYTVLDTTPPNSITGLSNTTTCNSINWTWTNPTDADYNGLMVWKNGTFFHNLSSSATSDLWLNLTELTEYTFSSKTFDATNNINATFVNRTSTTSKCPPGPIASFISNVTCGIVPFRVQFNDTTYSSTNLTGWNWSFGDGNYSAVQNPVFEYNISGMFTVNINATNAWGSNISQIPNYMRGVPDWATCPVTPTPTPTWQPDINPSTELDVQPNGWWLIAGGMILFIWFIFRRTR